MDRWSEPIVEALEAVRPHVVHVHVRQRKGSIAFGSGLALDHRHLVTNAQIALGAEEIAVTLARGRKVEAFVRGVDPLYYLAVLELATRVELPALPTAPTEGLPPGTLAIAVGNPLGTDHTVSLGVVSAVDRTIYRPDQFPVDGLIVTDAAIHPGNAGGALATLEGRVIGLNGVPWTHGMGLAIEIEVAVRIAHQILDRGRATHPWLGFAAEPEVIEPTLVSLFELPIDHGLVVERVRPDSPGDRAGLQPFDMIIRAAGRTVASQGAIRKALSPFRAGDRVPLTVFRNGRLIDLEMPVEEMPRLPAIASEAEEDGEEA